MGENSKIEWTDHTFNPWIGCQKVSEGCAHCYAEARDRRGLNGPERLWGPDAPRRVTSEANWRLPFRWQRQAMIDTIRRRVFRASLADVFEGRSELESPRRDLFRMIWGTRFLDWLLLTKRPENIAGMLPDPAQSSEDYGQIPEWGPGWRNVWLGTSVENQKQAELRIPHLQAVPATIRFLSVEPLLGPLNLAAHLEGIHWVIVGGESGPGARPMHPDWVRSLRDQCAVAGVAFFFKQWGGVSKKDARRTLDGREWSSLPR